VTASSPAKDQTDAETSDLEMDQDVVQEEVEPVAETRRSTRNSKEKKPSNTQEEVVNVTKKNRQRKQKKISPAPDVASDMVGGDISTQVATGDTEAASRKSKRNKRSKHDAEPIAAKDYAHEDGPQNAVAEDSVPKSTRTRPTRSRRNREPESDDAAAVTDEAQPEPAATESKTRKSKNSKRSRSSPTRDGNPPEVVETQDYFMADTQGSMAPPPEQPVYNSGQDDASVNDDLLAASQLQNASQEREREVQSSAPLSKGKKKRHSETANEEDDSSRLQNVSQEAELEVPSSALSTKGKKKRHSKSGNGEEDTTEKPKRRRKSKPVEEEDIPADEETGPSSQPPNSSIKEPLIPDSQPQHNAISDVLSHSYAPGGDSNISGKTDVNHEAADLSISKHKNSSAKSYAKAGKRKEALNIEVSEVEASETESIHEQPLSSPAVTGSGSNQLASTHKTPSIYSATPKSSKKRSLPVDYDSLVASTDKPKKRVKTSEAKLKTSKKAAEKTADKADKPPKAESKASEYTIKGKITDAEAAVIKLALARFRDMHDVTESEQNDLIQSNAQSGKAASLWAWVLPELPDRGRMSVIRYCRRKYHNYAKRGGWSPEEDEDLRLAFEKKPNKWKEIAAILDRHPEDVRDRYRNYLICGDKMKKDTWSEQEENDLRNAVAKFFEKELASRREQMEQDPSLHLSLDLTDDDIQWPIISEYMGRTRSRLQCSSKWKLLREREAPPPNYVIEDLQMTTSWRRDRAEQDYRAMKVGDKYRLICAIRDSRAGRESKIPWSRLVDEEYRKTFGSMLIKVCWLKLKASVRGNENMALQDIVDRILERFERERPEKLADFTTSGPPPKRAYKKSDSSKQPRSEEVVVDEDGEEDTEHAEDKMERRRLRKERKEKKAARKRDRMSGNEDEEQVSRNGINDDIEMGDAEHDEHENEEEREEQELGGASPALSVQSVEENHAEDYLSGEEALHEIRNNSRRNGHATAPATAEQSASTSPYNDASLDESDGADIESSTPKRPASPFDFQYTRREGNGVASQETSSLSGNDKEVARSAKRVRRRVNREGSVEME
jgi:hypothetical protein